MDSFLQTRALAYRALCENAEKRCFLRLCAENDALWVCDLPRHTADVARARRALESLQVIVRQDEASGLWRMDMAGEWYAALDGALPWEPPALPENEELHAAYALCRLLWLHPWPLARQPMEPVRAVIKQSGASARTMNAVIAPLHRQCAALTRRRQPLPTLAGKLIRQWLWEQEREGKACC